MEDYLKEYKLELQKVYEKSQDAFEKQLSFISAGALGFSMLFVEKAINNFEVSKNKWLIIVSWFLFGLTLIVNLYSHHLSARNTFKTIAEINNDSYEPKKVEDRIFWVNLFNKITIAMLCLGIGLFIIYVLKNI
jgi:hypothetical protein